MPKKAKKRDRLYQSDMDDNVVLLGGRLLSPDFRFVGGS
jgi:hypothetical protein